MDLLTAVGQQHVVERARELGCTDALAQQVCELDSKYPGGLAAYVDRSRALLADARQGKNPFLAMHPSRPACEELPFASEAFFAAERQGLEEAAGVCFVLVAGGLGERLGFSGIKVALPSETCSNTCFLELFIKHILALQLEVNDKHPGAAVEIPLVIMTSNDTHARTQELLAKNDNFGMASGQIRLLMQDKVASVCDVEGRFGTVEDSSSNTIQILTKPHGHGDVHLLLHQSGIANDWLGSGKTWVAFIQDTNAMVFRSLVAGIGVSAQRGFEGNFVAVPRKAKSAAGAIMALSEKGAEACSSRWNLNVEYNYVDDVLKAHGSSEGDVNGADGFSTFPGNTNQLIFSLKTYVSVLESSSGLVPEFVNPKYSDESRAEFKPTRLECMMQDVLQLFPKTAPVGVTVFGDQQAHASLTHSLYCPVKNNLKDGGVKAKKGIPSATAASAECAVYTANSCMLRSIGASVAGAASCELGGVAEMMSPRLVFLPRFVPAYDRLKSRFPNPAKVSITQRSVLVVDGDVTFNELDLDGVCIVRAIQGASVVVEKAVVHNDGWPVVEVDENDSSQPEQTKIRGFRFQREGQTICELTVETPGHHVVELPAAASAGRL